MAKKTPAKRNMADSTLRLHRALRKEITLIKARVTVLEKLVGPAQPDHRDVFGKGGA